MVDKTVLIVDGSKYVVEQLRAAAIHEGYLALSASDGEDALRIYREQDPDVVILDVMIPKINGLDVCRQIRQSSNIPVIIVSDKKSEDDIIKGFEAGADDYVGKPFSAREVITRMKAILRRSGITGKMDMSKRIEISDLVVDMNSYEVFIAGVCVSLTKKEIEILWLFATNPGKVFTRDHLLENVWGYEYFGNTRTVDTHIKRIRTKLNLDDRSGFDIKTVWGVGYKFEVK